MRKHKREGGRGGRKDCGGQRKTEKDRRPDLSSFRKRGEDGERRRVCAAARPWRDVGGGAELGEDGHRKETALEGGCNGDSEGARCVASLSPPPPGRSASGKERSGERKGKGKDDSGLLERERRI